MLRVQTVSLPGSVAAGRSQATGRKGGWPWQLSKSFDGRVAESRLPHTLAVLKVKISFCVFFILSVHAEIKLSLYREYDKFFLGCLEITNMTEYAERIYAYTWRGPKDSRHKTENFSVSNGPT